MLFSPWQSQTNSEQQERNKQQGQNGPRVKMGFCYLPHERVKMGWCCLPPDRVKLTVNSKKETNSKVKMGRESKWPRVKMGFCYLPPERVKMGQKSLWAAVVYPPDRVKLAVNSRVKMGKGSRWASVIYPLKKSKWGLLLFTPWQSQTNSEQQEGNKHQGQNGQRVKIGQRSRSASVLYPLAESN